MVFGGWGGQKTKKTKHSKWIKCHEILNGRQSRARQAANGAPTKHLSLSVFPDNGGGCSGHLETKHQHGESERLRVCMFVCMRVCLQAKPKKKNMAELKTELSAHSHSKGLKPSRRSHGKRHKRRRQCAAVAAAAAAGVKRGDLPVQGQIS